MVASLRDWSSPLFEWNVCRGDHWSPVCVIEIHREPPLSRQCRQLPSRGALRNVAENKKPPIEGEAWHDGTSDGGSRASVLQNQIWLHTKLQTNAVVLLSEKLQTKRQSIDCL